MMNKDEEFVFSSPLDKSLNVAIVYPGSSKYEMLSPHFERAGHAFLLHDLKLVVIDGSAINEDWFSEDHLLVIQAHELGHFLADHSKIDQIDHRDEGIEREADWIGFNLLSSRGYKSASDLHRDEYKERYGNFPEADNELFLNLKKFAK